MKPRIRMYTKDPYHSDSEYTLWGIYLEDRSMLFVRVYYSLMCNKYKQQALEALYASYKKP